MSSRKGNNTGGSSSSRRRKRNDGIRKEIKPIRMADLESGLPMRVADLESGLPNHRQGSTVGQISGCMLGAAVLCWAVSLGLIVKTQNEDNMTIHVILVLVTAASPILIWVMQHLNDQVIPHLHKTKDAYWIYVINLIQSLLSTGTLVGSLKIHLDDDKSEWRFAIGMMVGLMLFQIGSRSSDDFGGVGLILGSLFVRLQKKMDLGYLLIMGFFIDFVKRILVTLLKTLEPHEELQDQPQLLTEEQKREREELEQMKKEVEQARQEFEMKKQEFEMKKQKLRSDILEIQGCVKLVYTNLNRKRVHIPEFNKMKECIENIKI